ncbi:hypothetical protein [Actinomycetospora aeridis]|uniref:Transmembrane protein n=1 Tax=Actinomycetospora aeridis TaxID=3129231 RepID=A0ABU8NE15_9PSEU
MLSLVAFVLVAGFVTALVVAFTGWTNEDCAPGAFACDAAAVLRVRVLLAASFVLGLVLGVVGTVRAARGRRAGWWIALAWPVWLVGLAVGEVASRR